MSGEHEETVRIMTEAVPQMLKSFVLALETMGAVTVVSRSAKGKMYEIA